MSFAMINPVDEGLLIIVLILIISWITGGSIWEYHIEFLNISTKVVFIWQIIILALIFSIPTSIKIISHSSIGYFFKVNCELILFSILTVCYFSFFKNDWIQYHPKMIFFLYSMVYSKMTIELILAHILKTEIRVCISELWLTIIFITSCFILLEVLPDNQDV